MMLSESSAPSSFWQFVGLANIANASFVMFNVANASLVMLTFRMEA